MKTSCKFILSLLLVIFTGFSAVGAETPDGRIEGFVSGLNGSSASGVKVNIWDGKVLKRAVSGRDGKFIVSGIIPGSSFAIRLTMPDSQTVRAEGLRCPERGGLTLTAGFEKTSAGHEYSLRLPSNPSTGYSWTLLGKGRESILAFKEKMVEGPEEKDEVGGHAKGGSGHEIWKFNAAAPGRSDILLAYHRPWETAVPPVRYHISSVRVK